MGECDDYYGCAFCKTRHEAIVAKRLGKQWKCVRATPVFQIKHKSVKGIKTLEKAILLPGYVFFRTSQDVVANELANMHGVLRLLRESEQDWRLRGENLEFAKWVFQNDGVIGLSEAHKADGVISISAGPLKEHEDSIIKLDRHNRNGLVDIRFDGRSFCVWLAFEVL